MADNVCNWTQHTEKDDLITIILQPLFHTSIIFATTGFQLDPENTLLVLCQLTTPDTEMNAFSLLTHDIDPLVMIWLKCFK